MNLVANSVRALGPDGGAIILRGESIDSDWIRITVMDDGPGFDPGARRAGSFGLTQVFERVESVYGSRGQVQVQSRPGAGAAVCIDLPWSEPPA